MKKLVFLALLYILSSCHEGTSFSAPSGVIPPDSMVQVLTDVHIFQATLQLGYFKSDSAQVAAKAFEDILSKHHLTQSEYSKCLEYYCYHPALFDDIYEKVLNNISRQKAELLGKKHL
jgi:hypothetical protein